MEVSGLYVVYITRYVIRIKKHLHNRIEIIDIDIESNRKEYEALCPTSLGSGTRTFAAKIKESGCHIVDTWQLLTFTWGVYIVWIDL